MEPCEDVPLGMPQGTVLTTVLFLIISDKNREVKESVIRSFADDDKVIKKI